MLGGYAGKILRVNLTERSAWSEPLDEGIARRFIGGRGLGGYFLWKEVGPEVAPLSPENKLFIMVGPAAGTPIPASNRYCIVTKSPETGLFLDSYSGGSFGPAVKFAGYDMIAIEGKAEQPIYLFIDDDVVEFRDASHLWGKGGFETEETIEKEIGDKTVRICVIGPGGERLSNLATVQNEYYHQAGRGGVGAVFGAKNLKAIAVRGSKGARIARPQELVKYLTDVIEPKFQGAGSLGAVADRMKFGTPLTLNITNKVGILPTRNFQAGQFEGWEEIDAHAFRRRVVVSDKGCYSCNMSCTKFSRNKTGPYKGEAVGGTEYETNGMMGANLGIASIEYCVHANVLCDDLGIDTIGAGNVVAFVMECYERGILTEEEIGFPAPFGCEEAADRLMRMIAYREGIGDLLADGVRAAAQKIGRGSEEFAMHTRGLEFPAYRPGPCSPGFALAYMVADRGACHRRAWPAIAEQKYPKGTTEGRAELVKFLYDQRIIWHCGVCCDIGTLTPSMTFEDAAQMYSQVIGWDLSANEAQFLADRVASLLQAYNLRGGLTRDQVMLPARSYMTETSGPCEGMQLTEAMCNTMLDEYYALRGWDQRGVPARERLAELGLSDVAEELTTLGFYGEGGAAR